MSTSAISILELARMFPDDATAEKAFEAVRWRNGVECPRCRSRNVREASSHPTMPHYCNPCRRYFSVKTGTVMEASNLGYRVWALASHLLASRPKGIAARQLAKDLGVTEKTAWFLGHRIREVWRETRIAKSHGPLEVDETFIGGKESNKHRSKKPRRVTGWMGKTPLMGFLDRDTDTVRTEVIESTRRRVMEPAVLRRIYAGCRIFTDESGSYRGLPNHVATNHSRGYYVEGEAHTNGIESFWALLKRGIVGTYHSISPKHTQRYADEFSGRHNIRGFPDRDKLKSVVFGMEGRRLTYADLIA